MTNASSSSYSERPISVGRRTNSTVAGLVATALRNWSTERCALRWMPEHRFDKGYFPTLGQYDWFSGIVLYCIVREIKPQRVIEFSTSSGYSTCFTALALRANGHGVVHTVDIDDGALPVARRNWNELDVADRVVFHKGDCAEVVPELLREPPEILFIDSLHSAAMVQWYMAAAIPRVDRSALIHVHDVMPPEARVRIHGGPPWPHKYKRFEAAQPRLLQAKRFAWRMLHRKPRVPTEAPNWDVVDWKALDNEVEGRAFDGNYFEEARLLRPVLARIPSNDAVFLHRLEREIAADYPELQQFASQDQIGRTSEDGQPLEWNDAVWTRGSALADAWESRTV